ncbi:MJ0042 family finger-like domain-containing protein [Pseudomonas linyingensis]|uniref:MJ0042 family finger-like domain-containing protein n=1 Tax=Pseudomonas linyingensis TaxID=915471 RepID=A0A1H6TDA4_9PSED|nr:DUF3426 domain-containing protein [Pseudomonas linyingensis]SEI75067.1 MJ0042 family finger-like domain-containing protein [Pseudomonas linyingensis]
MTESFVTQCPHCQTRFRVTPAQLGMARGAVRCGACLQVFNAAEQLAGELAASPAEAPGTETRTPDSAVAAAVAASDVRAAMGGALAGGAASTLAGSTLDQDDSEHFQPAGYQPAPPLPTDDAPPAAAPAAPAPAPADGTLWIHDDLDLDDLDLDLDEELDRASFELSSEFRDYQPPENPLLNPFGDAPDSRRDPHDESWVEALLNDQPEAKTPTSEPGGRRAEPSLDDELPLEMDNGSEDLVEFADDAEEAARHVDTGLSAERDEPITVSAAAASLGAAAAAGSARRSEPRLRDEGLLSLNDEPLQLDWQPQQGPGWARRLLWLLLILLALGGLAGQYVYYHFDELARDDRLRPWFDKVCPLLGCSLPPRVDVSLVKSSNLTVRNHPTHPGALTVDAIIYNRATFSQPFPLLELRFEDINGQPLARRSFKPGEYLAGELAGRTDMPPQTPIHISLEIVDPGTHAVNYSLGFHSPD